MSLAEMLQHLATWTPFLLGGFGMNILISLVAMGVGTAIGWVLALMRLSKRPRRARAAVWITEVTRAMPTIVFQFYLAFMIPVEFVLPGTGTVVSFPVWVKAALALAVAVAAFTSDSLAVAVAEWKQGNHRAAFLFMPSWTSYALIIVMASSTASIIGVSELVSRCNAVISATGNTQLMLPVYLYACVLFFAFCWPLTLLMRRISRTLAERLAPPPSGVAPGADGVADELRPTGA